MVQKSDKFLKLATNLSKFSPQTFPLSVFSLKATILSIRRSFTSQSITNALLSSFIRFFHCQSFALHSKRGIGQCSIGI